ncbi:MAG: DUF1223 domain-containing protein [Thermoanaerobaculia bacterium]|nr:DUF1223 domain-containing protein [Thermoanaerobaculia bacterium]
MRQHAIVARDVTAFRNRRAGFFVVGSMKLLLVSVSLLALSCSGSAESSPPPAAEGIAVLELFTSQGCSSCPPADALLAKLDSEPSLRGRVIALSFHVDYWNHLGWSDPFSAREWSQRQRDYSRTLRGDVYTPQLVVNGTRGIVGSSEHAVRDAIGAAIVEAPSARLMLSAMSTPSGAIAIDVKGTQSTGATLEVWVALVEDGLVTDVGRGENGGRTLRNDNVVRVLQRAATLRPRGDGAGQLEIRPDPSWKLDRLEVVAFAQSPKSSKIHGAAATRVPVL